MSDSFVLMSPSCVDIMKSFLFLTTFLKVNILFEYKDYFLLNIYDYH